jgi:hypothetical protein
MPAVGSTNLQRELAISVETNCTLIDLFIDQGACFLRRGFANPPGLRARRRCPSTPRAATTT